MKRRLGRPLILFVLIALLYAYVLHLPLFWDDGPVLSWVMTHDWRSILLSTENGYYRPLAFALYRSGIELFPLGSARATALHLLGPLALWIASLALMQGIGGRRGFISALFLITFPLLNEAIAWVTALSHPLTLCLTLLAFYAFRRYEARGEGGLIGFIALLLAPLAHESGVMAAWIVAGTLMLQNGPKRPYFRRPATARWLIAALIFTTATVPARRLIPGVHSGMELGGLHQLKENFFYYLQVLLYPLGQPIGYAVQHLGLHDFTTLSLVALLIGGWGLAVRRGQERHFLAALWWWSIAALPFIIELDYQALFVGSRLSAYASVGAALFWATLIEATVSHLALQQRERVRLWLIALIVLPALAYHQHVTVLYRTLGELYNEVIEVAHAHPDRPLTFINLPSALTWTERTFPLVTDNVVFVPDQYTSLRLFLLVNEGLHDVKAFTYGALYQQTEPFWLSQGPWIDERTMREAVWGQETFLARYEASDQRFHLLAAGTLTELPRSTQAPIRFEDGTQLLGASLVDLGAGRYRLWLHWLAVGPVDATVFVHVVDGHGTLLTQADGDSLAGLLPLRQWRKGDYVIDGRTFHLPADQHGDFLVHVGLYTGSRRYAAYLNGERVHDDAPVVAQGRRP